LKKFRGIPDWLKIDTKSKFVFLTLKKELKEAVMLKMIKVKSVKREELINVTSEIKKYIAKIDLNHGKITLFVPHTTAAVTINENADPDVPHDIIFGLGKIAPNVSAYHHAEGNSDAHIKSTLVGCSQDILVENGQMVLGTWQGIFFCEFDGPRTRKLYIYSSEER
jgi:secondary thiamine-phosphate synthase enzyme